MPKKEMYLVCPKCLHDGYNVQIFKRTKSVMVTKRGIPIHTAGYINYECTICGSKAIDTNK